MTVIGTRARALGSAAIIAIAWQGAAYAQTEGPTATTATPSAPVSAQSDPSEGEIVVTGIRASAQAAQEIKRKASSVVEAITTKDLGRFQDASIGESLQRAPGVQIQRNDDGRSGDRASIRGFGAEYITTTVNGREIASAGGGANGGPDPTDRVFNFDQIPSEILTSVLIYKSPTASMVEPGIAGAVDLRTLRPLDFNVRGGGNVFGIASGRVDYDETASRAGPSGTLLLGGKFINDTLGVYIGVTGGRTPRKINQLEVQQSRRDIRVASATGVVTTLPGVISQNQWQLIEQDSNVERLAITAGLQWKPSSHWEVNLDYGNNRLTQKGGYSELRLLAAGTTGTDLYSGTFQPGGITVNGSGAVIGFDSSRAGGGTAQVLLTEEGRVNRQTLEFGGANVAWKGETVNVTLDYSRSHAEWRETLFDGGFSYSPLGLPFRFDGSDARRPQFTLGPQAQDTANYSCPSFFLNKVTGTAAGCFYLQQIQTTADREGVQLDLSWRISNSISLKFGGRYQTTTFDVRYGTGCCGTAPLTGFGIGANDAILTSPEYRRALFPGGTRSTFPGVGIAGYPVVGVEEPCRVLGGLCDITQYGVGSFTGPIPASTAVNAADVLSPVFGTIFQVRERNVGLYGEVDFEGDVAGLLVEGNVGLRAVQLRDVATAFRGSVVVASPQTTSTVVSSSLTRVTDRNSQWELLPTANLTLHPSDNVNIRLALARVISPANFSQLAPRGSLTSFAFNPGNQAGFGSSGSTSLKPTSSLNYDLTGEIYTANRGSVIISAFYKDLRDFITTTAVNNVVIGGVTYNLVAPTNFSDGRVYGFELGANQPFTFLPSPFDGFGLQANYTYVNSKFDRSDPIISAGVPGSAKHNFNSIVYYEKGGFGARLAVTYRGRYFNQIGQSNSGQAFSRFTAPTTTVDGSISYAFLDRFEAVASVQNITKVERFDYINDPSILASLYRRPRTFSFGLRARY